jgi:hypothetical protein
VNEFSWQQRTHFRGRLSQWFPWVGLFLYFLIHKTRFLLRCDSLTDEEQEKNWKMADCLRDEVESYLYESEKSWHHRWCHQRMSSECSLHTHVKLGERIEKRGSSPESTVWVTLIHHWLDLFLQVKVGDVVKLQL